MNSRRFALLERNASFCRSPTTSKIRPNRKRARPAQSHPHMGGSTPSELMKSTGRLTPHAHIIWKTQKPRKAQKRERMTSKRASCPRLMTRYRR